MLVMFDIVFYKMLKIDIIALKNQKNAANFEQKFANLLPKNSKYGTLLL